MSWPLNRRARQALVPAFALVIGAINFAFCRDLFSIVFLRNLGSNEGAAATLAKFLQAHPTSQWYPNWSVGLPIEHTYSPVIPALTALLATAASSEIPLCLHRTAALFFLAGPILWFLLALRWTGSPSKAFSGSLVYSLFSMAAICIPAIRADIPHYYDSKRLWNVIAYADIAHMAELCLLAAALALIYSCCLEFNPLNLALAVAASSLTVLTDAFGIAGLSITCTAMLLVRPTGELKRTAACVACVAALTAFVCSPFLTPNLLATITQNTGGLAAGGHPLLVRTVAWAAILGLVTVVSRLVAAPEFSRFVWAFAIVVCGILVAFYYFGLTLVPQPNRYELEADVALAFSFVELASLLPGRARSVVAVTGLVLCSAQAINVYRFNKTFVVPLDILSTPEYKCAEWLSTHLPGQRAMVSGDAEFWFNYFSGNPQLSGSHEPFSPNRSQQIAVFIIYSGLNAGDRDAAIAEVWLKAYGVTAITVPGPDSKEWIHPFTRPDKFDGVLPVLARFDGDTIYRVPQRSAGIVHVLSAESLVARQPIHGLDIDMAEKYVRALDNEALPLPRIEWTGPGDAEIHANVLPGQVISMQESYYPGWTAVCDGKQQEVTKDGLGLIVVRPNCRAGSKISLRFQPTPLRLFWRALSLATLGALGACVIWSNAVSHFGLQGRRPSAAKR